LRNLTDIPKDKTLNVAFLHADMSGHSHLVIRYQEKFEPVRKAFQKYVEEKASRLSGAMFSWEGDGGTFVFWGEEVDFISGAVYAALSILSEMYVFNLEHNQFPEFIDVKVGVHLGSVKTRESPGDWYGEELNFAGKFFKDPNGIRPGTVSLTKSVFNSLALRTRERFHHTREFQGIEIYEFGRELLDPNFELFVGWISSDRTIDIKNPQGDTLIKHEISIINPHPSRDLDALSLHIGSPELEMEWKNCEVKAWEKKSGQILKVEPIDVDDPYIKIWRIRFPALRPGSPPYQLAYSCCWNHMLPRKKDRWESKIPGPIEAFKIRIIFPPGQKLVEGSLLVSRFIDPGTAEYLTGMCCAIEPEKSESGRWEGWLTVMRPLPYYTYRLEWELENIS